MFELIVVIIFAWLLFQAIKLAVSITWGLAKVLAVLLCIVAVPGLVVGLISAAGAMLLVPVGLIAGAWGLLKVCG